MRDIIDSGEIFASDDCRIFKAKLVYTFYGRPAFRKKTDDSVTDLTFLFPVAVILDPDALPKPSYVFAFDTGAFVDGYMDDYLDPYMPLFDFHLVPEIDSAQRLASAVFGDTDSYLHNNPKSSFSPPTGNFEAVSYEKLVNSAGRGDNKLDDRVSTPEIIFDKPIPIEKAIKVIILPDSLASDARIGGRLEALKIPMDPYIWTGGSRPAEYHMLIRSMAKRHVIIR